MGPVSDRYTQQHAHIGLQTHLHCHSLPSTSSSQTWAGLCSWLRDAMQKETDPLLTTTCNVVASLPSALNGMKQGLLARCPLPLGTRAGQGGLSKKLWKNWKR